MNEEIEMEEAPKKKKPGWPKGKPRKVAAAPREPMREAPRVSVSAVDYMDEDENDRLKVPKELIPPGMDYQWVTASILGQPQPQRRSRFERRGWVPVPAERHPGLFMPKGHVGEIEVDGLVLYERPLEISIQARARDKSKAREQVYVKEHQLMGGDVGASLDSRHRSAINSNKINKSYERMSIPEE